MIALALGALAQIHVPTIAIRGANGTTWPMPAVGLGSAFGPFATPAAEAETYAAVKLYLESGGRMVHAARMYCNQQAVGRAIRDSGVPRSDLFVATMVPQWHLGAKEAAASVRVSLHELGLEYVDLAMMHWPGMFGAEVGMRVPCEPAPVAEPACKRGAWSWKACRRETWAAFVALQQGGAVRAIGVSNFETWLLDELHPPPAVNQVPYRVGFHDDVLLEHAAKLGTVTQAYSPYASGAVFDNTTAANALLVKIGEAHGVSDAQVPPALGSHPPPPPSPLPHLPHLPRRSRSGSSCRAAARPSRRPGACRTWSPSPTSSTSS